MLKMFMYLVSHPNMFPHTLALEGTRREQSPGGARSPAVGLADAVAHLQREVGRPAFGIHVQSHREDANPAPALAPGQIYVDEST